MKIIIDTFGADKGEREIIKGAFLAAKKYTEHKFVLVGDEDVISDELGDTSLIDIIKTKKFISQSDAPTTVFTANNSSMAIALDTLKNDPEALGLLSAGNSGALFVGTICRLGLAKGLKVPALSAMIPTVSGGRVCLADCGANINCVPSDLRNFAIMASAFMKSVRGIEDPRVGLLSIGKEDSKGSKFSLEAFSILRDTPINFIGNIESDDIMSDRVDVVVSDGFSGNILLKSIEAVGLAAADAVKDTKNGTVDKPYGAAYNKLVDIFDLNSKGGATFLGTNKPVIKMHGSANASTVLYCAGQLADYCRTDYSEAVAAALG